MLDSRIWEEPFKNTVEGRPFPVSVIIESDRVLLCAGQPVQKGAAPRPELIPELLKSEISLSDDIRRVIADWFDPDGQTAFCFKQFKRRKPGRHSAWEETKFDIGLFVEQRIEQGQKFESVMADSCIRFGKSRSTIADAYSKLKDARQVER